MTMNGIPVKLLNEAQGHIVSLELTTGATYRGKLVESEDSMNVQLRDGSNIRTWVTDQIYRCSRSLKECTIIQKKLIKTYATNKRT